MSLKILKRFYACCCLLMLLVFALALGITSGAGANANSEEKIYFDSTYVIDDLYGANFAFNDYPKDENGILSLIYFAEYGYSVRQNEQKDYGVYVYVYNPSENTIIRNGNNFIQMAVKYENGKPVDYDNYELKFLSMSSGVYGEIFYKFKVNAGINNLLAGLNGEERRYDVSGITLQHIGDTNATEYAVGRTYIYTGFSKGYGLDKEAESTLSCRTEELETICLDVHHTTYKYQNSKNTVTEVATAYFAVPEKYFKSYGRLQKIKAEWIKAVTDYILVCKDLNFYNKAYARLGVTGSGYNKDSTVMAERLWENNAYYPPQSVREIAWNTSDPNLYHKYIYTLNWLFYSYNLESISANEVLEYIDDHADLNLFTNELVKESHVIDATEDTFDLIGLDANANIFAKIYSWLYPDIETGKIENISPIVDIKAKDFTGDKNVDSKKLLINKNDLDTVKIFCQTAEDNDYRVVLFRFASHDYSSESCRCEYIDGGSHRSEGYFAKTTVYLDFKVIWLGFQKKDTLTIIPTVASPINIAGSLEKPIESHPENILPALGQEIKDWWTNATDKGKSNWEKFLEALKIIAALLALVFVIWFVYFVIKIIVDAVKNISNKK